MVFGEMSVGWRRRVVATIATCGVALAGPVALAPAAGPCKGLHGTTKKECKVATKKPKKAKPCKGLHGQAKKACKRGSTTP